jgi:hypothetical protein
MGNARKCWKNKTARDAADGMSAYSTSQRPFLLHEGKSWAKVRVFKKNSVRAGNGLNRN